MKNVLGKVIIAASAFLVFSQTANASSAEYSGFYAVPKAVVILGTDINHHGHEMKGDSGFGIGIDLGYSYTKNYAIEACVTYAEADVTGEVDHSLVTKKAEYTTYGVMGVYSKTLTGHLRFLAKLGYGWEYELIEHCDVKQTLSGVTYAVGLEYGVADNMEVVFEYEGAEVVSTRGGSLMFGLKYKF